MKQKLLWLMPEFKKGKENNSFFYQLNWLIFYFEIKKEPQIYWTFCINKDMSFIKIHIFYFCINIIDFSKPISYLLKKLNKLTYKPLA